MAAKRDAVYRRTQLSIVLFKERDAESIDIPSLQVCTRQDDLHHLAYMVLTRQGVGGGTRTRRAPPLFTYAAHNKV